MVGREISIVIASFDFTLAFAIILKQHKKKAKGQRKRYSVPLTLSGFLKLFIIYFNY